MVQFLRRKRVLLFGETLLLTDSDIYLGASLVCCGGMSAPNYTAPVSKLGFPQAPVGQYQPLTQFSQYSAAQTQPGQVQHNGQIGVPGEVQQHQYVNGYVPPPNAFSTAPKLNNDAPSNFPPSFPGGSQIGSSIATPNPVTQTQFPTATPYSQFNGPAQTAASAFGRVATAPASYLPPPTISEAKLLNNYQPPAMSTPSANQHQPPVTSSFPGFPAQVVPNSEPQVFPAPVTPVSAFPQSHTQPASSIYPPSVNQTSFPTSQPPAYPTSQPQQHQPYGSTLPGQPTTFNGLPAPGYGGQMSQIQQGVQGMNISGGYGDVVDILSERHIITTGFEDVHVNLPQTVANHEARVDSSVFRCTLNAVPNSEELVKKSRLPFGLTLHPFKDMKNLNIIQTSTIVRCRYCRTYINPFVQMPDHRHWKCNLCMRVNDLPDDFCWDPVSKSFGDPCLRPEIKNATVEFIAPSEYMLRAPQPAVYVFVLDVSAAAIENGYLYTVSEQLLINLDHLPGDERTQVAFVAVDSSLHFFQFKNGSTRAPTELVVDDIEDAFLPTNTGILVNLKKSKDAIRSFIQRLPEIFDKPTSTGNALGAALNVVHELIADIGGRITVFQCSLPSLGPGKLESREDPNNRAAGPLEVAHLGPATDFYKRLALECTGHQVGIDLFLMNSQYADLATLGEMSKFSSGCVYHFPNYHMLNDMNQVKRLERIFARYLTRKIGFEAVLRIRCSRGLAVSNFYGNFFMRSTDLLSLANVNPDSAIAVQVNHEEKLTTNVACFQAALLYTSSKGDRRIRVHTMCLPIVSDLASIYGSFDLRATMSLLTKMGVDRCMTGASLNDAREATINAVIDSLGAYQKLVGGGRVGISAPRSGHLRLFPLIAHSLLKHQSFAAGRSVRLDDRVASMLLLRFCPLEQIMSELYPQLYRLNDVMKLPEGQDPHALPLSFEHIQRDGVYLMEAGSTLYIYIPNDADPTFVQNLFGCNSRQIDEHSWREQDNDVSRRVHSFVKGITSLKFFLSSPIVVREDSPLREVFVRRLVEDRTDSSFSYFEFLKHIKNEIQGS